MTQADLQKVLRAADPAAVLVSSRILERVIREDCGLPNMHWNIPHFKSYVCDRQALFRQAEQADLDLESDQLLPDTVILLVRPDAEEFSNLERKRLLLKYWRRLFHARIHLALGGPDALNRLDDQALRERIEVVGRTEFEEVRDVLTQDRWLFPEASDRQIYIEFAAVYLELRQFAASLLPNFFPGIRDFGKIEQLLARDVDSTTLFTQTRLAGAADPVQPVDTRSDESQELYWKLVRSAQKTAMKGNTVGAAILRIRASRVAPAALTLPTRQEAEKDVAQLTKRLAEALGLSDTEQADWARHLTLLLDKADQGNRPMEARVLEELQKVCQDHEQEIYTLDFVEYLLSGGKRPIKRPLPSQRMVRIAKHLRNTIALMGPVRLSDTDRNHLLRLLQHALTRTEEVMRTRFRPGLVTALEDMGLSPKGPLEQAAFDKMVAELLDRISTYGYLTFAELRDTISRNQLKLPDLREPEDFIRGDPLIRLDRRLASLFDGVYRPSEFYVRWLERFTSLKFGTRLGRWLTHFLTGPLLAAWLVLFTLGHLVDLVDKHLHEDPAMRTVEVVLKGQWFTSPEGLAEVPSVWWHVGILVPLSLFFMAVFHIERFRRRCAQGLLHTLRGVRYLLWDLPRQVIPIATIRQVVEGWAFQLLYWYILKPAVVASLLILVYTPLRVGWWMAVGTFIVVSVVVNSRLGRATSEAIRDALGNLGTLLRAGLLPGLLRLIVQMFHLFLEGVEYVLFVVDEGLRFRSGDSQFSLVLRTIAGVLWFPISFFARFYMVVLIEPMVNPLKLPISILAAKLVYPLLVMAGVFDLQTLSSPLVEPVSHYIGFWPAWLLVIGTIYLSPDAIAWLVWEMKENWGLYRSNRPRTIHALGVGGHGETVRGLLQTGFHSGTVPRLYARLRLAERRAMATRNWTRARTYRRELEEISHSVEQFVSRDMLVILKQSRVWRDKAVSAGPVYLSTNRIRVELEHLDHPALPVEIEIEHQAGWLVAGIPSPGWLETLEPEELRVFTACLAYLYKRADVDLVREQLLALLPGPIAAIKWTSEEMLVWPSLDVLPIRFPLREGPEEIDLPSGVQMDQLVFGRQVITWEAWADAWRLDQEGKGHPGLPGLGEQLVRFPLSDGPGTPNLPLSNSQGLAGSQAPSETSVHHGQETIEPGPETQGEAERADPEATGSPTGIAGVHRERVQEA